MITTSDGMGLTAKQLEGVQTNGRPTLVCAGAGAGKTRVLTRKVEKIIRQDGVQPDRVAAITFTKKAAAEMRSRLYPLLGNDAFRAVVCNWHSFALNQILRPASQCAHPFLAVQGFNPNHEIIVLDDADAGRVLREAIKEELLPDEREAWEELGGKGSKVESMMGLARSHGRQPKEHLAWQNNAWVGVPSSPALTKEKSLFAYNVRIWRRYERALRALNAVDFDNILIIAVKLLEADPVFTSKLANTFQHILADEHQDANPIQGRLLKLIARDGKGLTLVGDEKQSIYAFRAADVRQLLDAHKDYPGLVVVDMAENFRSSNQVITLANELAAQMSERITSGQMIPMRGTAGSVPLLKEFETDIGEAAWVADQIEALIASGVSRTDIAVLYRAKIVKEPLEKELLARLIDFQVVGDMGFFDRAEVKDWVCVLRFIANSRDVMAASRVIDAAAIGSQGMTMRRAVNDRKISVYDYMDEMAKKGGEKTASRRDGFARLKECCSVLSEAVRIIPSRDALARDIKRPPDDEAVAKLWTSYLQELVDSMLHVWDEMFSERFRQEAASKQKAKHDDDDAESVESAVSSRRANVAALLNRMVREVGVTGNLIDAIRDITILVDSADAEMNGVSLMTEHASKGLEFPHVFVIGAEDQLHFKPNDLHPNEEEERRLAYVAVTRAEQEVTITCAQKRLVHGELKTHSPLRFFLDVSASNLRVERVEQPVSSPVRQPQVVRGFAL